jgi:hypothetical protein
MIMISSELCLNEYQWISSNNLKLILENIIDTLNVVDTFRYKYPNRKSYTFTNNRGQGSRIDKIYIPTLWCDKIKQTTHIPFEKSDHKAVVLVLKFWKKLYLNFLFSFYLFPTSQVENTLIFLIPIPSKKFQLA